jgi:hypothetical protein
MLTIALFYEAGMAGMVGLRTDWALAEDDECLRLFLHYFHLF